VLIASFALLFALSDVPVSAAPPAGSPRAEPGSSAATTTPTVAATPVSSAPPASAVAADAQDTSQRGRQNPPLRLVWRDRPSLRAGRWLRLDLTTRIQLDTLHPGDDPVDFDEVQLTRARVGVDGELFRVIEFSVERELTESGDVKVNAKSMKTQWRDVYGELRLSDAFRARGGRFKVPFSLDQLTSSAQNDFVFRSLGADYLAPGRDAGGMIHGRLFGRRVNYSGGVFALDGDNSRSTMVAGGDRTVAVRVTARPFGRLRTLNADRAEFGGSFASTDVSDASELPNGLRGRTVISEFSFFEPVFVRGSRNRYGVDFDWTNDQFGARAEYMAVTDEREGQGLLGNDLNSARARAYYIEGTWVVTGDRKDRPLAPRRPLFVRGAGAVEIAARYERLWFDSRKTGEPAFSNSRAEVILPSGDRVVTLGLNWYLNRWVKLQLNALHEELQDPGRTPLLDGGTSFWSSVFRLQFAM
jgi:phosphate-selective porin OprO/OprP